MTKQLDRTPAIQTQIASIIKDRRPRPRNPNLIHAGLGYEEQDAHYYKVHLQIESLSNARCSPDFLTRSKHTGNSRKKRKTQKEFVD